MCVRLCVCERESVWKKEAEPVNGELIGFLPLETTNSAVLLFMWTLSSTATTTRPKGIRAVSRGGGLA